MYRVTREAALWCAIAILAFVPRLARLDFPLTNAEATAALTSLAATQGNSAVFPNPLFGWLQTLLFILFGASETSARLIPALSGVALCLLPATLRRPVGRTRALLFAALLTLAPTLWFVSRESVGSMLAWTLAFAAHCAWHVNRPIPATVALGALLATGSDAIAPLIVTVTASLVATPFDGARFSARWIAAVLLTFILSATGLFMRLSGLGDAFYGYALWAQSLRAEESSSIGRLLLGLLVAEPIALVGAAFAIGVVFVRLRSMPRADRAWLVWIAAGLVLFAVTAERNAALLTPVVIGVVGLASVAYEVLLVSMRRWAVWQYEGAVAGVAFVLMIYASLGLWQYAGQGRGMWLVSMLIAALLLLALVAAGSLIIDYGAPLRGVALAGIAVLSLYSLGAGIQMNHARPHNPAEPYRLEASALDLEALRNSIRLVSLRATGEPYALAVQVAGEAPPVLRWALRDQREPTSDASPSSAEIVLTPTSAKPQGAGNFVGVAYAVTAQSPLSEVRCASLPQGGLDCLSLARWLAFREASEVPTDRWVFWLRDDVARRASGER